LSYSSFSTFKFNFSFSFTKATLPLHINYSDKAVTVRAFYWQRVIALTRSKTKTHSLNEQSLGLERLDACPGEHLQTKSTNHIEKTWLQKF